MQQAPEHAVFASVGGNDSSVGAGSNVLLHHKLARLHARVMTIVYVHQTLQEARRNSRVTHVKLHKAIVTHKATPAS